MTFQPNIPAFEIEPLSLVPDYKKPEEDQFASLGWKELAQLILHSPTGQPEHAIEFVEHDALVSYRSNTKVINQTLR